VERKCVAKEENGGSNDDTHDGDEEDCGHIGNTDHGEGREKVADKVSGQ
jgi:hypothetical protein